MLNLLFFILRTSRSLFILSVIAGIISGVSSVGMIALINSALSNADSQSATLILSFCLLCVIRLITGFASQGLLLYLSQDAISDLRTKLSKKILATRLRRLEEIGPHRLLATLTDDVLIISNAFISIPLMLVSIAIVFGCLFYLGWLSWVVLLAVVGCIVAWALSYKLILGRALFYLDLARQGTDKLFKHYRALTRGAKELKLHYQRAQDFHLNFLTPTTESLQNSNIKGEIIYAAATNWGRLVVFVFIGLLIFALPRFSIMEANVLTGLTITILYMTAPLDVIFNQIPVLSRASIALKNIDALGLSLSDHSSEDSSDAYASPVPSWKSLELKGVVHTYHREKEDSRFTLGPINMTLRPGELMFLVGGNGSGKTTLAKLLTGLYTPESGEIIFDGVHITDANRVSYRQNFSAVFSDFYLFDNLIGPNRSEIDAKALEYLVQFQLNHKVRVKDGLFSSIDLSQGQRKRLALLSSYLEDRPIYLFDEWASDQDPLFKDIFYLQLLPELKSRGKTVITISHDDKYFHVADRIFKLDYGQLREINICRKRNC